MKKRKPAAKPVKRIPAHIDRLYKAVANYVGKSGGEVLVIGGVQTLQWPTDGEFRFSICIPCTGRKPIIKEAK